MAVFKLFHWSDNHNDANVTNVTMFAYNNIEDLDAVIHTGDIVNDDFSESIANSSPYDFLFVVGNHDMITATGTQSNPYDWTLQPTQAQMYSKYMVPTVVEQGAIITEDTTWWYKDYDDKKIEIIGLNCQVRNSTDGVNQRQFLGDRLLWCKNNGYAVIVAMHITPYDAPLLVCNYTCDKMVSIGGFDDSSWQAGNNPLYPEIQRIYNVLVSWSEQVKILALITGHAHGDGIGKSGATSQIPSGGEPFPIICVGSTRLAPYWHSTQNWNDLIRTTSQPCANLYEYDSDADSLTVHRIGASCKPNGTIRSMAVWNYRTKDWVEFLSR